MPNADPFLIHEDDIRDRNLREDRLALRWVEDTGGAVNQVIYHLRAALRRKHVRAAFVIFIMSVIFLFARSLQLQVIEHDKYALAAESNRLRIVRVRAPRGQILDRRSTPLTKNVPRFQLILDPLDFMNDQADRDQHLAKLATIAEISRDDLERMTTITRLPIAPITLKSNLILDDAYTLLLAAQDIPGVTLESISTREYPYGLTLAHILGYLGPIPREAIENYLAQGYNPDDLVGLSGLELVFQNSLRGRDGRRYIEIDAAGQTRHTVALEEAVPGASLKLGIDLELQIVAEKALSEGLLRARAARGAVVVMDPNQGEIMAMISLPAFDNNLFTSRKDAAPEIARLFSNPNQPLFPRAVSGTYPSGSTIKPAVAAAGLSSGIITEHTSFLSSGGVRVGQWFFPDWKAGGHGLTDVRRAIAESINTFFYIVGGGYGNIEGLGIERLAAALRGFGFGTATGIELVGEAAGLVPDATWKESAKKERWYIGDTYHTAIGQGDILVTPLQITRMTAYFASRGKWVSPHLVVRDSEPTPPRSDLIEMKSNDLEVVRQGMRDTVRYGSARSLSTLALDIAGKTGTAQWSSTAKPHAWFTGFGPYDNPEIVVTVLIEEGGEGSEGAVPVAREIFFWWNKSR